MFSFVQRNAASTNETDSRVWELVENVVAMNPVKAYACAFLNMIFAGTGTIASAFLGAERGVNKT